MQCTEKRFSAGTLESSDVLVTVEYCPDGNKIEIDSVVGAQFGDQIEKAVADVVREMDVHNARIRLVDRGALDCVIRARVETALLRGREGV